MLAIAILGGSLAALSSVVLNGADAAIDARNRALAQLLCERQMAQVLLSNGPPVPINEQPVESPDPTTMYLASVQVQPAPLQGLLAIQVSITAQAADGSGPPTTVSLIRWMVDPALGLEAAEAEEKAAADEAAAAAGSASDEAAE
ncbi:prepilin-type cleavage/methylation domain-containing protein [Candidatus Laterigemmans baculatus]|uniref:prepilin-type cleavage/methylation domain-containing protein n=1 Tax=Candidatus Laterigemmans baculatus TaxID=2770505 RepID=UPI0013D9B3FB|nr:prepilin-type cleavage/methylation domain-containing protein [Candidatus Laterigemmans baculatus]